MPTPVTTFYREHPIKILRYSAKNLWLLIFPLLRSLRFYPFSLQNLLDWGAGVWFDLLVALLILVIGTLRWLSCVYYFNAVSIRSHSGILIQQEIEIPLERITTTVEEHPLYLRPIHGVQLQISTAAGVMPNSSMKLLLRLQDLHQLRRHIPVLKPDSSKAQVYRTSTWHVLLFSVLFSSSLSGAIYLTTLFIQGGRILSDLFQQFQGQQLLEDVTQRASSMRVLRGVPHAAITIGIVILALWLLSFCRNLLRYSRFRIRFGGEFISVHMGLITRRRFHLREDAIVFPDLRQNLIMKLCGMVSLHIRCPGYGSRKDTLPVLIPLMQKKSSQPMLQKLHARPKLQHPQYRARPKPRCFWSFLWQPVLGICAILPVRFALLWLLPDFQAVIRFFSVMLLIPLIWFFCVRIAALFSEYLLMEDHTLQLHFSRGFAFHTITVDTSRIVRADLRQNPFQKQYGICHLYLVCNGPRQQRYKLAALPEQTARAVVAALNQTIDLF